MEVLRVLIPVKFTQGNLDDVINEYYDKSINSEYTLIIFDLSLLEWINTEEIAFLFAWITNLRHLNKKLKIWLPYTQNIYDQRLYKLENDLARVKALLPIDDFEHIQRRRNRNVFLLSVWGMLDNLGLPSTDFLNIAENYNVKGSVVLEKFSHQIIPFTAISAQRPSSSISNPYDDVMNGTNILNRRRNVGPFDLTKEITNRLEYFNCYSPFENKIISNVITKELFANSLIHANVSGKLNGHEECYFALSLNNRWENDESINFINQFVLEKDPDTLDFFKDKRFLLDDFKRRISRATPEQIKNFTSYREAEISRYKSNFKNISYLEFTFLDFGDGIYSTLSEKFSKYVESEFTYEGFKNEVPENQILEYAFFTESSSNQYDARLENPELFPRGLYFLVDMVRRYKGLLVVRSGDGKIIYDFSDRVFIVNTGKALQPVLEPTITLQEALKICNNKNSFFDGTMVSIVLPERKKEDVSYSPVRIDSKGLMRDIYLSNLNTEQTPRAIFKPKTYEYISMLFLYERVIIKITPKELQKPKGFDSLIYIELLSELKKRSEKMCLIFIDFEHYPRTDNIQQLLFYLTNSPFINEWTKAVIINLEDTQSSDKNHKTRLSVLKDFKVNLYAQDNEPHIFRPIPSINVDMYNREKLTVKNIQWIGVKHEEDESILNKLLIGAIESVPKKNILSSTYNVGNIFAYNQDELYPIFNTSLELIEKFEESRQMEICTFIQNLIIDGSKVKPNKKHFIYQAAKGNFQLKYLTLYETLHNKYLAKFFAKRLLDQYYNHYKDKELLKFNKIITVTVSSQLLGVAIRNLINEDPVYAFLKTGTGKTIESCPKLIILSSYYSFEDEKPFNKIDKDDLVLIVNDVISTGSLVNKLTEGIVKRKNARVVGVISIGDARLKDSEIDPLTEEKSFFAENESHYFNLISSERREIELRKYKTRAKAVEVFNEEFKLALKPEQIEIKRINPLLNTVVELSDEYGEKQRVLFTNPNDFLPNDPEERKHYQEKYLRIGHFVQNLSHNSYLTNMRLLFSDDEGIRILKIIKEEIDNEYQNNLYHVISDDISKLFSMKSLAEQIEDKSVGTPLTKQLNDLITVSAFDEKTAKKPYSYKPDFIFYPIFSGIENVSHETFHELFGTDFEFIIGLQRFDTDKGWRFPFPPKRFNNITKGKHLLIFDSGALTGESLVQMIDSLSFLEAAKIDVICVIGRIEDYNREFFSRIKALKVKNLNDKYYEQSIERKLNKEFIVKNKIAFANLNIIFGINFHIPVFPSKSMCPFCEEIAELKKHMGKFTDEKYPEATKNYINQRLQEIECSDLSITLDSKPPRYIPRLKKDTLDNNSKYDLISIFLMRDKLGKIDSYRFYKEYYFPFDEEIIDHLDPECWPESGVLRNLELIMICILHEPKLFKVHKDLLVNIHDKCRSILLDIVSGRANVENLFYEWKSYSIVNLVWLYFENEFFELTFMEMLLNFLHNDQQALNFISYRFLSKISFKINPESYKDKYIMTLLSISHRFEYDKDYLNNPAKIRPVVTELVAYLDPTDIRSTAAAFYNLRMFFEKRSLDNKHNQLKEKISFLRSRVKNVLLPEIEEMAITAQLIIIILKDEVFASINKIKETQAFRYIPEVESKILFGENSVSKSLQKIISDHEVIVGMTGFKQNIDKFNLLAEFTAELIDFQFAFLRNSSPFYNFCKNYPCELKAVIDSSWEEINFREKNDYNVKVINEIDVNFLINIHKSYMTYALLELFNNAMKERSNQNGHISFYIVHNLKGEYLVISQNKPFIPNDQHTGGLDKYVLPIFESFFEKKNVKVNKSDTAFIIQIFLQTDTNETFTENE